MGRTESSAIRIGQNSPRAGSHTPRQSFEPPDFELEDLAAAYGARIPSALSFDTIDAPVTRGDAARGVAKV